MSGDAVLSAFLQVVFQKALEAASVEMGLIRGVPKELDKLRITVRNISDVLEDAEGKQIKEAPVREWLRGIKDIAYDADDLLDEFAWRALKRQVEGAEQAAHGFSSSCFCGITQVFFRSRIAHRIKSIRERLDEIGNERRRLHLRELTDTGRFETQKRAPTSSLVDESNVFGREKDKDKLVQMLLSEETDSPAKCAVVSIVGLGGLGKSTLAQLVYNDGRVEEHFDLKMWVFVSHNYDVSKLTKAMVEAATMRRADVDESNLNVLQQSLKRELTGKRFLLVLDDVWDENRAKWDKLRLPLDFGKRGSRIVITTRIKRVAEIMSTVAPYNLKHLPDKACWDLFCKSALGDGDFTRGYQELEEIGKKIVLKLNGLPLAVKTVGSTLSEKLDENHWRSVLQNEIWDLGWDQGDVLPALRLSYQKLPSHLRQCFSYCSIFPKGHEFDKDKLVKLWMAQGFLQQQGGSSSKRMEDVGSDYFDDLLGRSFFQNSKDSYLKHHNLKGNASYVMHDMIYALARFVSIDECYPVQYGGNPSKIPGKVRHLSLNSDNRQFVPFESLYSFSSLRTLAAWQSFSAHSMQIPDEAFVRLKFLRVLDLGGSFLKNVPETVGSLRHLRYLDLSATSVEQLPASISTLYNLQTLQLKDCFSLKGLPNGMSKLINLRHLEADPSLISKINGIGKLTCLQQLSLFMVQREMGHRISELKHMNELHGDISISNLENVADEEGGWEASLDSKQHLRKLELEWTADRRAMMMNSRDEGVLQDLRPHFNIQELSIDGYNGNRFPSWVGDPAFNSLKNLCLYYCKQCSLLPPLGQLRYLERLNIQGLHRVKQVGHEFCGYGSIKGFPSLRQLHFEEMSGWGVWSGVETGHFPRLSELSIKDCPNLRGVPSLPCLSSLLISECSKLQYLPSRNLSMLERLEIRCCEELTLLPETEGQGLQFMISLKHLEVDNCPKLMSPQTADDDACLPVSLQSLRLSNCSDTTNPLFRAIKFMTSLQNLRIANCTNMKYLPAGLHNLTSLYILQIHKCPRLEALPEDGMPANLQCLSIKECPILNERCQKERGADWSKICQIRTLSINDQQL